MNFNRSGLIRATTVVTMVCLFIATVSGSMSFVFAIEASVASHEFCFLGFRVLLSSASYSVNICGDSSIDVHMISSLRGGVSSIVVPPILVVVPSIGVLLGGEFECLEESLTFLGELSCCLPLEVGFVGLFFPLFESPLDFCGRVEGGGINDGTGESFGHRVFESFDGSLVV